MFSFKVSSTIETLVKLHHLPKEALVTAWFIKSVRTWFDIIELNASAKLLEIAEFNKIISELHFTQTWKPIQTGIKLTTLSFIALVKELLSENLSFILSCTF